MDEKINMLRDEYRLRFTKAEQYRNEVWKILCGEFFNKLISPQDRVLDLGCGWGEFINNINASVKYAMDLNPDAKTRLSADTHFIHQDCSQEWQIATGTLDVVFTSNFLEHLADKGQVEHTISQAYRCLKPDGLLICMGPNIKYIAGKYWDFWDHFVPISDRSISEMLKLNKFDIDLCIPRFLPYSMSHGRTPPLFLVNLYLRVSAIWPLFGKQFLVIGRKVQHLKESVRPGELNVSFKGKLKLTK